MDDGRRHIFEREETAVDRLDHGYAVTVHRAQGATVDVAHRFEDGGGRELAYVSMSRARQRSTVHVVADNLDQAVEDLRRDWAQERRPRWAIDTGTPTTDPLAAEHETGCAGRAAMVAPPRPPPSRTGRPRWRSSRPTRPASSSEPSPASPTCASNCRTSSTAPAATSTARSAPPLDASRRRPAPRRSPSAPLPTRTSAGE